MSLFDRVKAYFSSDSFQKDPELVSFAELDPPKTEMLPVAPTASSVQMPVVMPDKNTFLEDPQPETKSWILSPPSPPMEWPSWLEDETLLRDEGVIFGLSESKSEEKVAIIRNYFIHQTPRPCFRQSFSAIAAIGWMAYSRTV